MSQPTYAKPRPGEDAGPRAERKREIVDEARREAMTHLSPDGRPPARRTERRSTLVLPIVLLVVVAGLALIAALGGPSALGMTLVYLAIMLLAGFPVWMSVLLRQGEEKRAVREGRGIVRGWQMAGESDVGTEPGIPAPAGSAGPEADSPDATGIPTLHH